VTWVIEYDCGECQIVEGMTHGEAMAYQDDLGCHPQSAYAPSEVILRGDPWMKNGLLRCVIERKVLTGESYVRQARAYLNVPYHHCGRNRFGLDCLGLVMVVAHDLGLTDWDITNYTERVDCGLMREGIERFCAAVPTAERLPGDVLLFAMKGLPQHLGIATEGGVIHTHQAVGRVVEHRFNAIWEKRLLGAFRWRGDEGWRHSH
jgi:hypothetical protein